MPPRTQRNPAYLTISIVFESGCPRSGKVVSTPMLFEKVGRRDGGRRAPARGRRRKHDPVEDLLIEVLGSQQNQLAERARGGVGEPHRWRRRPCSSPCWRWSRPRRIRGRSSGGSSRRRRERTAWLASISSGAQVLSLGGNAAGDFAPLHGPGCLAAVDLEDVAVAPGIQEHERDRVGALGRVPQPQP